MKDTTIAYIAGIIDGEGTITLAKQNSSDQFRQPVISVSSTTKELLDFLQEAYGGYICTHKTYKEHHQPHWSWRVVRRKAIQVAQDILPYLIEPTKKYRAELLAQQYLKVTPRNGRYSEEQVAAKESFEASFFHPSDT